MDKEIIKDILQKIENVKSGKDVTKELRDTIRKVLFVSILEELKKDEKWHGIDEVIRNIKNPKILEKSKFRVKGLEYDKIPLDGQISVASFNEETNKSTIDYFGFRVYPDKNASKQQNYINYGVEISLGGGERKFFIGVVAPYEGKGEQGKYKKFNKESENKRFLERLSLEKLKEKEDPIGTITEILKKKMDMIVDDMKNNFKDLKELVKVYHLSSKSKKKEEKKKKEKESHPPQSQNSNSKLSPILNALSTKPFLILAGISGTGKTQIARIIASVVSNPSGKKPEEYINESLILKKEKVAEEKDAKEKDAETGVAFLPVRPDWNEPKKMWGYYNPLTGLFYPTDGLIVLLNAYRDFVMNKSKLKYFIILDEMNLARVEYYMSDLLSLMENMWKRDGEKIKAGETAMIHPLSRCVFSKLPTKEEIDKLKEVKDKYTKTEGEEIEWKIEGEKLCREDCSGCPYEALRSEKKSGDKAKENLIAIIDAFRPIPPRIAYPENLTIIGTVNVDETTFSFSPKVLDRAFVIEFNEVDPKSYLNGCANNYDYFLNFVTDLIRILKPAELHFGYRVINEMLKYLLKAGAIKEKENKFDLSELKEDKKTYKHFDFLIVSKVLPKIHGTEERIGTILHNLYAYCFNEGVIKKEDILKDEIWEKECNDTNFKYLESAKKIKAMHTKLKATGYCSYF